MKDLPYRPCVGIMLVNKDDQVFVGQRIDSQFDAWQMPQGGIDAGETAEQAALRELGEETGLRSDRVSIMAQTEGWHNYDLPDDLIGKLWGGKYRGQRQKWFLMQFLGQDGDIQIETEHQEFSQWKWLDRADLLDAIVPFKRDVYRNILQEFDVHFS